MFVHTLPAPGAALRGGVSSKGFSCSCCKCFININLHGCRSAVRYVGVVQKAYQETDSVISSVTTKVKGFAFTNTSYMEPRFWDVVDYVMPPQVFLLIEAFKCCYYSCHDFDYSAACVTLVLLLYQGHNSFFVLTNMIVTPKQTQTRCPEVRLCLHSLM